MRQEEGHCSGSCLSASLLVDPLQLTGGLLLSSQERVGLWDRRGCPVGVKPEASASVRKGIWQAWWRPPCYLAQAQRGVSHASLAT